MTSRPIRRPRAIRGLVFALCVALAGCSSVVSGTPKAARHVASSGPIQPSQLVELLTPSGSLSVISGQPLSDDDMQSALFVGADPARCQGVVGYGGYPLLPGGYTGRDGHTQQDRAATQHQLLEVSATYPGTFDAASFLDSLRKTVADCQQPVLAWGVDGRKVTINPTPLVAGPPEIAQWATNMAGQQWFCEFAVVAKANVVSELVTCSPDRAPDITVLAAKRLDKINELLNSTA